MPEPTGWLSYLPLSRPSDIRGRLMTPESALQLSAAPDAPLGITVASSVFTTLITHGLADWTAVQFQSSLTLPAPLLVNTTYYVRETTDTTFKLASAIGGSAITITTAGTGQVTVRNWALNDVMEAKITLGDSYIYDELLALVMDHIRPWSTNTFAGYFPDIGYNSVAVRTPRDRAVIVLDNLINPADMLWASVDTAIWLMCQDGALRNQIFDASFEAARGPSLESRKKKLADESIAKQARLLMVDTANGAYGLFNFDITTDSVTITLL